MNYETLYAFILSTAALAIAPGPDNIYVLMQSMVHGKKCGMATVAGLISGCLVHTTLLAFGLSAIIKESDTLFFGIKLFGALYLFYLAFRVFISGTDLHLSNDQIPKKSFGSLFRQGFLMNVLNPKVAIFFLAFFPGFLFSDSLGTFVQFYVLGLLFMLISFVVFGFIVLLSGSIFEFIKHHSKTGRFLKWFQIVVFFGIGVYLLFSNK